MIDAPGENGSTDRNFGDGSILRDFLYVQDTVDAIMMAALREEAYGEVFNVGVDKPICFLDLVKTIIDLGGGGNWEFAPFTPERAVQEPGDFYSDISKARAVIGWEPKTGIREGIAGTIDYYRKNKTYYW